MLGLQSSWHGMSGRAVLPASCAPCNCVYGPRGVRAVARRASAPAQRLGAAAADPESLYGHWATSLAPSPAAQSHAPTIGGLVHNRVVRTQRGYWRIRHYQPSDFYAVADLQTAAFFEAPAVNAFGNLAHTLFKAEVVDALKKKAKALQDDHFAMMVVESCQLGSPDNVTGNGTLAAVALAAEAHGSGTSSSSNSSNDECEQGGELAVWYGDQQQQFLQLDTTQAVDSNGQQGPIIGVVEIGIQCAQNVLQHLRHGTEQYAYISSMAVAPHLRRSGLGCALLQAAEQQAASWKQSVIALHVFCSNIPAVKLYDKYGLKCRARDPLWKAMLGGKVQQLMVKELTAGSQS
eukprot:GHRR01002078.1.p1 GENE.GHRR01002078.1~~GHRR01002078.1.p1  ORF type:complete len:348 (+),score=117.71 GHRR01002078.1:1513-2556(+)